MIPYDSSSALQAIWRVHDREQFESCIVDRGVSIIRDIFS